MEGAKLNQEEIDVGFGQFILKQFKLRRNLRLFHQKNYSHIDLICSKYKDGHSEHCTDLCSELNDNSANIFGEFERILQELQRREELIRELLAKIEKYESSPKESKSHSSSDPPNYSKPALEFNQGSQYTEVKDMSSVHNNEGDCILLWRSILNEMTNFKFSRGLDCSNSEKSGGTLCKHEQLANLYKNKLILLYEEIERLKTGLKSNQ